MAVNNNDIDLDPDRCFDYNVPQLTREVIDKMEVFDAHQITNDHSILTHCWSLGASSEWAVFYLQGACYLAFSKTPGINLLVYVVFLIKLVFISPKGILLCIDKAF